MKFPDSLLAKLASARDVVAFTGAGISAESGVPTFRGNEGIWTKFKPEELANLNAFMRNPELVWEWYSARKKVIAEVQPNAGHYALAEMEKIFSSLAVITQNIDNLHRRAGSRNVFELHGNIERNYCMRCGKQFSNEFVLTGKAVPKCECGGLIRPDVVWFGELLPEDEWRGAEKACQRADVLFSIGTSGVVYPAAALPMEAKRNGAFIIEINPQPTPLTEYADEFLQGKSGSILPALLQQMKQLQQSRVQP
ncbi:MAG: NAD-dependent deacylase [Bacteroidetes bacterium]|nr:NAD-dependent deacylase [Bacteroidota bacterium]MCW5894728.1 NAD-dependent deacylase [Bacteroidota bacterium]